jgi:cation transport regulator
MPYRQNADLPPSVRGHLPDHAQDVSRETFNHAYGQLAGARDREQRAHMIAWSAVKRTYVREDSGWFER